MQALSQKVRWRMRVGFRKSFCRSSRFAQTHFCGTFARQSWPSRGKMDKKLAQGSRARSSSSARDMMGSPKLAPSPLSPLNSQNLLLHPSPHPPPISSYPTAPAAGSSEAKPVACRSPLHQEPQLGSARIETFFTSNPPPDPPLQPPWLGHNYNNTKTITPQPSQYRCPTRSPYYSFPPLPTPSPPPPPPPPPWQSPSLSTLGTALAISLAALSCPPAESYQFPSNQAIHPVWNLLSLWL